MKRRFLVGLISLVLIVLLIGFVSTWTDNGNSSQNVDGCNELNTTGATYTLTSNVSSSGTCFNITAQNITLDCAGYWINYSTGGSDNTYGIYTNQFNTTVKNCNVVDGRFSSVNTERHGIYVYDSDFINLLNCSSSVNNSVAIFFEGTNFSNLINNTGISRNRGIHFLDMSNSLLINNLANSSSNTAIHFYGTCSNNSLINNSAYGKEYGLYFESIYLAKSITNNILENNLFISSEGTALVLSESYNNTITNLTAEGRGIYGIGLPSSANNVFRDCIYIYGESQDIDLGWDSGSMNNTFVNCSINSAYIPVVENWFLTKWYYQAYVNNTAGSPVSNANITAYSYNGQLQFTTLTDVNGWIQRQEITEYNATRDGKVYYSNYMIFANKSGAISNDTNLLNITVTQNNLNDFFTLEESNLNCGILDTANTVYTLTSNVSSSGTCFNITAQNITLDCAGYWINYSTGGSDNTYGIYTNQFNTTVKNCNVVDGNYSSTATLRRGIYFSNSDNSTLYRNFAISNNSNAIDVRSDSAYVNLTNNTGISTFNRGIYLSVTRSILVDNLGMSNSTHAFDIGGGSTHSLFINNIGITNTTNGNGIILYFADNNTLINCSGTSKDEGVIIHGSKYNVFIGITAIGVSAGSEGIRIEESNHSLFRDCLNITGGSVDVITTDSLNSTFINCSYNTESVNVEPNYLIRKWYYQSYVNDSIGFSTANVNISAYNATGQIQFTQLTNSSGLIDRQEVIEYVNTGGTRSYYNNYTINASLTGYEIESNVFNFTTTQNKIYDLFTLQGEVLQCGILDTANTVYILTQNVSSNGTCFTITQPNITLDCAGYWINYSINGTDYERGIYTNQLNTTIKNCNIIDGNITNTNTNRQGIYFYQSSNGTIENNTVISNNSQAVHLRLNSQFNNITNNIFHGFTDIGLDMHTSDKNNITNNLFITDSSIDSAWVIYQSSDNLFVNNTGIGGGYGIYVVGTTSTPSNNNIFINNTAISDVGDAIRLVLGEDNLFINQIAISYSPGDYAIIIDDVNNTKFIDCINITASPTQIYIHTGTSLNNSFINCSYDSDWVREGETELIRKWYYQAYTNYTNGTAVEGANITSYDSTGEIQFSDLTNSSGYIDRQEIIEYVNAGGIRYDYNNYTINATLLDYDIDANYFNFSIIQNKIDDIFTLTGGPDITSPNYSFVHHNTTSSNKFSLFSIYVVDNYLLHPNGQYIFSTNNTGVWVNDSVVNFTSTPSWANVTKTLNSTVGMVVGYRWYFNDSAGNINSTPEYIFTTTESSLFPYFTFVPENSYLFYANQSLGVYFDATDETEFGYFSVNDTRFLINQSGYLSSLASLAAGNYYINITINNSLGNINWTIYSVEINKSVSEVYLYANNLRSNVTISNGSFIWLNGTLQSGVGVINLYNNGTLVNFGSSPIYNLTSFSSVGIYNITLIYPGNENYTSSYETWWVNSTNLSLYNPTYFVVNHTSVTEFENIPNYWIEQAKKLTLHYAHTSHGEQIIQGSEYVESSVNSKYNIAVRVASTEGLPADITALRIYDGNPPETYIAPEDYWDNVTASDALTRTTAVADTGNYNISMWSWCGQQSDNSIEQVELYLNNMYWLQQQYPNMTFILMTGHLASQNNEYIYSNLMRDTLKRNNDMVRNFAIEYNMTLFDFADLDGHNGTSYCYTNDYHAAYNNTIVECEWPSSPSFECAHSEGANCERKANAFWVMMAKIAGWNGQNNTAPVTSISSPSNGSSLSPGQITFQCNLTDDYDLKNTTLYVWNSTGNLISSNLSSNISGTSNSTNINYTLNNDGNYLWNCLTYDGDSVSSFSLTNNTLIISSGADTTPPTYSSVAHNSTLENYFVLFSIYINDNSELNPNGQYIFSTNNTGVWVNDSAVNFTSTPSWANVTKTLNSSVGMVVGYKWYFNDSAGNTNSTEIYTFIITSDSIPGENSCGTLDTENNGYILTQNVSSNGTCFTISAENITLDCNNYWINYSQYEFGYGVNITSLNNITVKNCNIFGGEQENYTHGILIYNSTNVNLSKNNINTLGDISDSVSIYNSTHVSISNNTLINSGYNGHGVYSSFSSYNNITNSNINVDYYGIFLEYSSNNYNFSNLEIYTDYGAGIIINSSADNNSLSNLDIVSSGLAQGMILSSNFNYLYALNIISNLGESLKVSGSYNDIILSRFNSTHNNSVYFNGGYVNLFVNNTLLSSSGNVNNSLLKISYLAYNNSFYWNNFTDTGGYYINNSNSTNKFNTSVLGNPQGNEYFDIFYKRVYDSNENSWGDDGEEYPLNSTNWGDKWIGYGADYAPTTTRKEDLISPIYNLVSRSSKIAGEVCNFRINVSDNYLLHPNGQYIYSTNNSGSWVNDTPVNFTSNPSLSYTPKTLNSSVGMVVGYRWYFNDFAGNRNSTRVYTLITEEEEEEEDNSGGGGGGSENELVTLKPSYPQIQEGYETPISKGYMIQFNLSEKGQYVANISDVNRFTGIVNFSINSTEYSVGLNRTIKINLNNDTYYDLEASLLLVTFFNSSRMLFKEIHEEMDPSNIPGLNETSLGNRTVVDFFGGNDNGNGIKFIYILIIAVIIVLISLIGYVVFIRLKKTLNPVEHKNL